MPRACVLREPKDSRSEVRRWRMIKNWSSFQAAEMMKTFDVTFTTESAW